MTTATEHSGQIRRGTVVLRALACVPVAAVHVFLLLLMRMAPHPNSKDRAALRRTSNGPRLSAAPIRWSVALYRYSLIHAQMHRGGERCLFLPSCTEYAERVGNVHGLIDGLVLIADRFRRCRADTTEDVVDFP